MSQVDVAHRIGLSQKRVSYLELNPEHISIAQMMAWCSTLGLELFVAPKPTERGDKSAPATSDW
jgi:HTH-type transcriptional regulator/antitoxin HipB